MTVHVVAYGSGNIRSILNALDRIGADAVAQTEPRKLRTASHVLLPGVGSFSAAMQLLNRGGWTDMICAHAAAGRSLLGICLGMQLLGTVGEEGGRARGLDLIGGRIAPIDASSGAVRIPHVGWNDVDFPRESDLFEDVPVGTDFYFSHSYALHPDDEGSVIASVKYGSCLVAAVEEGPVVGVQFHPEKSSRAGLRVLKNFVEN